VIKQSHRYSYRNNFMAFKAISIILISSSICLIISQIIGITAIDPQDLTNIKFWDHIYTSLNILAMFTLLLGLVGIFLYQYERLGKFGVMSFSLAFLGTVLIAGDAWFEAFVVPFLASVSPQIVNEDPSGSLIIGALLSFLSFSIGWILVGITSYKASVLPKYISILLIIGGIFGFKALTIPYLGILGISIGLLGRWMYRESIYHKSDSQIEEVSSIG
jgi:hypothetical protein